MKKVIIWQLSKTQSNILFEEHEQPNMFQKLRPKRSKIEKKPYSNKTNLRNDEVQQGLYQSELIQNKDFYKLSSNSNRGLNRWIKLRTDLNTLFFTVTKFWWKLY